MSAIASVLLFLASQDQIYFSNVTNGTELVMAFMVHRHGDRTPTTYTLQFSRDPQELEPLIKPYGYGQLTERGLRKSYELGKFIRKRYNNFLPTKYNESEIFIRSTDSTRAKMTVLAAMAAVFPPGEEDKLDSDLNWTPIPYTTLPRNNDYNMVYASCPAFIRNRHLSNRGMEEYGDIIQELNSLGYNVTLSSWNFIIIYDLLISELSMGFPLEPNLKKLLPKIEEAASKGWYNVFGREEHLAKESGVLLKEFFDTANALISGKPAHKIKIQSGHDSTVYPFIAATYARPQPTYIKYAALYSLELRKVVETGKYVVLPVYLPSPEKQEQYLQVAGCDHLLCDYEQFKGITSKYVLNEAEWRKLCSVD